MVSPMIGLLLLPATAALHVPQMRGPSRFFLDTADVVEWQTLLPLGIFHGHAIPLLATPSRAALNPLPVPPSGVTTNPVLLERAAVPCTVPACQRLADQAFALGAHELMLQAWGGGREALVSCGLALSEPDRDRLVIKLPVTEEGTAAAAALAPLGVRVCLTACYAKHQAIVAVGVGAEYLAPYLGRIDDAGMDGHAEIEAMQSIVQGLGGTTRVMAASIRDANSLARLAAAGLDTFTFSPAVARALFDDPLTQAASDVFEAAAAGEPVISVPPKPQSPISKPATTVVAPGVFSRASGGTAGGAAMGGGLNEEEKEALRRPPTKEEMTPGSDAMKARASLARRAYPSRVLTPLEAFNFLADEDNVRVVDVRTQGERSTHVINGRPGVAIRGADSLPLDAMVASGAPAVAGAAAHQGPLLLHCSKGPKALVALSYLAPLLPKGEEVYVVDGGVTAWEDNNLPIEMV